MHLKNIITERLTLMPVTVEITTGLLKKNTNALETHQITC